ncbi:MAG: recombinase family protein [Sphingomonadaceae bacterium]
MSEHPKIRSEHRQRMAYIYIRQSTLHQVSEHLESQDLQYQLRNRAEDLGWREERILTIDEDLGKSGISSLERTGFQRLFTDVGLGKVGIILVTDVSRIARNSADWHRLLELAAQNDVLVSDSSGVYNPVIYADRLLLGIQGVFAESQWYVMRRQMQAARLNKAKRGELAMQLPVGYTRLPNGEVVKEPDLQVQSAIEQIFRIFRREGSVRRVLGWMVEQRLKMPHRERNPLGEQVIRWDRPGYSALYQVLKLPTYAGAYAYGKREGAGESVRKKNRYRMAPPERWQVLIRDAHPAYITWEEYMENQRIMARSWNATPFAAHPQQENQGVHNQPFSSNEGSKPGGETDDGQGGFSAPGKGRALLQGLVCCGHCGRPMRVRYRDKPAYVCEATNRQYNDARCAFFPYAHVDRAVVTAFLAAVEPAQIEIALAAGAQIEEDRNALTRQWQQQLERARYDLSLARTRYEMVDPAMRLVAAELERDWEEKLAALALLEEQWEEVQSRELAPLAPEDEAQIRLLAADLPALWAAESTASRERKQLLRTLIRTIVLDSRREEGITHIHITWQSGATSALTTQRPKPGHPTNQPLLERVRFLAQNHADEQIALILNREGLVSSWHVKDDPAYVIGQPVTYWTQARVRNLRNKHQIPTGMPQLDKEGKPRADGLIPAAEAARQLKVSVGMLLQWFRMGLIPGRQTRPGTPVWIQLDETNRSRFDASLDRPAPGMVLLADAPRHFGLTRKQLHDAVNSCRLYTWRLAHGAQNRWFIAPYTSISAPSSTEGVDPLPK